MSRECKPPGLLPVHKTEAQKKTYYIIRQNERTETSVDSVRRKTNIRRNGSGGVKRIEIARLFRPTKLTIYSAVREPTYQFVDVFPSRQKKKKNDFAKDESKRFVCKIKKKTDCYDEEHIARWPFGLVRYYFTSESKSLRSKNDSELSSMVIL